MIQSHIRSYTDGVLTESMEQMNRKVGLDTRPAIRNRCHASSNRCLTSSNKNATRNKYKQKQY